MHRARTFFALVCAGLAVVAVAAAADEPKASFGFGVEVDGEGFFLNPTVKTITVTSVAASSPAARAGIAPKDRIVEADGHAVAGAKARDLQPIMSKKVGEALHLRLTRPNGDAYEATLIGVAKPAAP